jgi:hypothetical protein
MEELRMNADHEGAGPYLRDKEMNVADAPNHALNMMMRFAAGFIQYNRGCRITLLITPLINLAFWPINQVP